MKYRKERNGCSGKYMTLGRRQFNSPPAAVFSYWLRGDSNFIINIKPRAGIMLCHHVHCGGCCWRSEINFSRCLAKRRKPSLPLHLTQEFMHYGDRGVRQALSTIATIMCSLFEPLVPYRAHSFRRETDKSTLVQASPSVMRPILLTVWLLPQESNTEFKLIPLGPWFHISFIGRVVIYVWYERGHAVA